MKVTEIYLKGCFIIEPNTYEDNRGVFFESYHKKKFEEGIGQKIDFVQDNHSVSKKGVLRGLHFQKGEYAQSKLVRVIQGEVLDVVVDIREDSRTYGQHYKIKLSENNKKSLFIPKGMAHGFLTLSDEASFVYKCDNFYHSLSESGIIYNDPTLNIDWEFAQDLIILSIKDKALPQFKTL